MAALELTIKAKRHKGGTWSLYVTREDGSWAHHRGLVDDGHACSVAWQEIHMAEERAMGNQSARNLGGMG